jgi:hypothetical protein
MDLYVQGSAGIGTTSPSGKLHIVDSSQEIYTGGDHLYLKYTGAGHYPYIGFLDSGGVRGGYFRIWSTWVIYGATTRK